MEKAVAHVSRDPTPLGNNGGMIRFEFFDDGWSEDEDEKRTDLDMYLPQLEDSGKKALAGILSRHALDGRPVSCLITNPFLPWACDVAEALNIASVVLWVQSCACFSAYYHFENSLVPFPSEEQPKIDVQLPKMPLLKYDEIPSFLHASTPWRKGGRDERECVEVEEGRRGGCGRGRKIGPEYSRVCGRCLEDKYGEDNDDRASIAVCCA